MIFYSHKALILPQEDAINIEKLWSGLGAKFLLFVRSLHPSKEVNAMILNPKKWAKYICPCTGIRSHSLCQLRRSELLWVSSQISLIFPLVPWVKVEVEGPEIFLFFLSSDNIEEESKKHTQQQIDVETRRKYTEYSRNHQINQSNSFNTSNIHININNTIHL